MTPRKQQRRQNQNAHRYPVPVQTSDYESEAMAPSQQLIPEELNLVVLQRYVPSLVQILAQAPKGELYNFSTETNTWARGNVEGNLFVGKLTPSPITGAARHCIVILNRRGLDNLIIESGEIDSVEITDEFLLLGFRRQDDRHNAEVKVVGFYIFPDPGMHSREYICQMVKEHWEMAKMDQYRSGQQEAISYDDEVMESIEEGATVPLGRRLSLSELFGAR